MWSVDNSKPVSSHKSSTGYRGSRVGRGMTDTSCHCSLLCGQVGHFMLCGEIYTLAALYIHTLELHVELFCFVFPQLSHKRNLFFPHGVRNITPEKY